MGLEQRPQMALGGCDLAAEAIAIAVDGEVLPGTEQFTADLKPRLPEGPLVCEAFGVTKSRRR